MTPVEQIKDRLSIVDVVSSYIRLEPAGKSYKAKSPFTNEKTPSFFVSPDKGLYHCFSTGKGGDMFTFVEEMEGVDFHGSLKILAERAGVSLRKEDKKISDERDRLYDIMESATKFFEETLKNSPEALDYLKNRGVTDESIKEFRLGYVPLAWRNLYDFLKKNYSDKDIVTAGLGKKSEKGVYDVFRDRIMFPICDSAGRTIAFSGRILHPDEKSGKYVNSPETPIFKKSDVLFALDKAKNYIRKYNFTTLVEGQFDVLMLHQYGFKNTVGVSGTALSDSLVGVNNTTNNLGLVKRLSTNLILAFDADDAGIKAAKRSAEIAISLGMDVKAIAIPGAKDPAEFLKEEGKDSWNKILREAKHIIEFTTSHLKESAKDERELGRKIVEDVLPSVASLSSDIEKNYFLRKISVITGIDESILWRDLEKTKPSLNEMKVEYLSVENPKKNVQEEIERRLVGLYYESQNDENIRSKL
ncbi:MAG: DNA primase, partial [Bacteroidetes bacterium]|nr:DNA primase [Bacteroidota bacterium]